MRQGAEGDKIKKRASDACAEELRLDLMKTERTTGDFRAEELIYPCVPWHVAHCLVRGSSF